MTNIGLLVNHKIATLVFEVWMYMKKQGIKSLGVPELVHHNIKLWSAENGVGMNDAVEIAWEAFRRGGTVTPTQFVNKSVDEVDEKMIVSLSAAVRSIESGVALLKDFIDQIDRRDGTNDEKGIAPAAGNAVASESRRMASGVLQRLEESTRSAKNRTRRSNEATQGPRKAAEGFRSQTAKAK